MRPLRLVLLVAIPTPIVAQWRTDVDVDAITDARTPYAYVTGTGGETAFQGQPYLGIQCGMFDPVIYFETRGTFFNSGGDNIPVALRVDRNEAISTRFRANGEGTGGSLQVLSVTRQLVVQMRTGSRVLMRAQDFRGVDYDYAFSLAGFTASTSGLSCVTEIQEADVAARVPEEEAAYVGSVRTRARYQIADRCWRLLIAENDRIFFRSLEEANAAGYDREGIPCQ